MSVQHPPCHIGRYLQPGNLAATPPKQKDTNAVDDLFSTNTPSPGTDQRPLAARMRPTTLHDVIGQTHLIGEGLPLTNLAENLKTGQSALSAILWGPPGTGKTTLAGVLANETHADYHELSAITAGVKDIRTITERGRQQLSIQQRRTVLFLDEIHRFSKSQQDALLPAVEHGWIVLIAATTENPTFSVNAPLLSRSLLLKLKPHTNDDLHAIIDRALTSPHGYNNTLTLEPTTQQGLIQRAAGDARRCLTLLEAAATMTRAANETTITEQHVEATAQSAIVNYDKNGDQHYDVTSALIKSIRGSDIDAAIHYTARMIVAGEDPRFLCRRLVISAAEDIGLADPRALLIAQAAQQAVATIGLPEAKHILAEAVIYLASAPKSNAAYRAINQAIEDVNNGLAGPIPAHLRDGHYPGAAQLGHAVNYHYPHDHPAGVVAQQYAPDALVGRTYYQPTSRGYEGQIAPQINNLRSIIHATHGVPTNADQNTNR